MSLRILIADDDAVSRMVLSAYIHMLGHKVIETTDGTELIEEVNKKQHDLIITDLFMDNMDGEEAAQIIKLLAPNYIIVASSDETSSKLFNDVLLKPITMEKISEAINKFIYLTSIKKKI